MSSDSESLAWEDSDPGSSAWEDSDYETSGSDDSNHDCNSVGRASSSLGTTDEPRSSLNGEVVSPHSEESTVPEETVEMFLLAPPPEHEHFASEEDAQSYVRKWARQHGYSLTREKTPRNDMGKKRAVFYRCGRAGWPKNTRKLVESERVRQLRGSMKCNCPMRIKICAIDVNRPDKDWHIVYTEDGSKLHNHPPAGDVSVYPCYRRQEKSQTPSMIVSLDDLMRGHFTAGLSAGQIHTIIQAALPDSLLTEKDVANARAADRSTAVAEKTPTEAVFALLREHGFWYRFEVNEDTRELLRLFWAHPDSLQLYKDHPDVLIMDCTYKTNAHDMPLLNIVSMTGFNTVLPVAQCWMPGETEEDFMWALRILHELIQSNTVSLPHVILSDRDLACLNALDRVFPLIPSMICRWHMNQNVLTKVRAVLGQIPNPVMVGPRFINSPQTDAFMAIYYQTLEASTEDEFECGRVELSASNSTLADYLDLHWWRYKRRVVRCWTDTYHHFGYRDTSPVEGTHARIKRWLQSSKGDLFTVLRKLLPWWTKTIKKS